MTTVRLVAAWAIALAVFAPAQAPHLLITIGDSLMAGWNSAPVTGTPSGTVPGVEIWDQWYTDARFSSPDPGADWAPLRVDCGLKANGTLDGPGPLVSLATSYMQQVQPTKLFVIHFARPGSDVVRNMTPNGIGCWTAGGASWHPTVTGPRDPWQTFRDSYLRPARAALPTGTLLGGVVFSLGNNMAHQGVGCRHDVEFPFSVQTMLDAIKTELNVQGDVYATGFVNPFQPANTPQLPSLLDCQNAQQSWPRIYPKGVSADLRPFAAMLPTQPTDPVHFTGQGYLTLGRLLGAAHTGLIAGQFLPRL